MSLKERVYSVLIVSCAERFNTAVTEMLPQSKYNPVCFVTSISEAKRTVAERAFDFVIVNAPLPEEIGTRFAMDSCRSKSTVVLLIAGNDIYSEIHDKIMERGVFTLSKPTSRTAMMQALDWLASARERLRELEKKTLSVEERMEEIRIVNRAKCLLISELKMTEPDAHHYIERYAMDNCISKKEVAQNIIKLYS